MRVMLKPKRDGYELGFKVFVGSDGRQFLVFRSLDGSFHVFTEIEAKEAARMCGANELANTRKMWESLWSDETPEQPVCETVAFGLSSDENTAGS